MSNRWNAADKQVRRPFLQKNSKSFRLLLLVDRKIRLLARCTFNTRDLIGIFLILIPITWTRSKSLPILINDIVRTIFLARERQTLSQRNRCRSKSVASDFQIVSVDLRKEDVTFMSDINHKLQDSSYLY